jgi:hypothetical protein
MAVLRRWTTFGLVLIVSFCIPSGAAAQSVFVSGGAVVDVLQFGSTASVTPSMFDFDRSGNTYGISAGIGGMVAGHVPIQLELGLGGLVKRDFYPVKGSAGERLTDSHIRSEYRARHASMLVGYSSGASRRAAGTLLGGVMFLEERLRTLNTNASLSRVFSDSTIVTYRTEPMVGADLTLRLTPHVAVIPQVRIYKAPALSGLHEGALAIMPGVSARWTF